MIHNRVSQLTPSAWSHGCGRSCRPHVIQSMGCPQTRTGPPGWPSCKHHSTLAHCQVPYKCYTLCFGQFVFLIFCGGFFLACQDFGRMLNHPFPACPEFVFLFYIVVEISSCTPIPLFMPGSVNSGSVSWDDCGKMFPDKLHVSSLLDKFPNYAWTVA